MRAFLTFIFVVFLLHNSCKQTISKNSQPKQIVIGDYIFDFNSNYHQQADTASAHSGYIFGKGIRIEYTQGSVSKNQTKILEDTTVNVVKINTIQNLFKKIIYSKDLSHCGIGIILINLNDTSSILFPDRIDAFEMHSTEITKQQQDELLKIFETGRIK